MDGRDLSYLPHKLPAEVHGRSNLDLLSHWADTTQIRWPLSHSRTVQTDLSLPATEHNAGPLPPKNKANYTCLGKATEKYLIRHLHAREHKEIYFHPIPSVAKRCQKKWHLPWRGITFSHQTPFPRTAFNLSAIAQFIWVTWQTTFPD